MEVPCQIKILPKPALPSLPGARALNKSRRLSQTLQNATRTWTRQNHPASPNMSSLSILHLLLLLLALHAPQAKGLPVVTSRTPYSMLMKEIMDDLKKITPSPEVSSWDKVGKGQGRAGRCLGPIGLRGSLSLSLPHQGSLNSDEKNFLTVRVQPHTWVNLGGFPSTSCLVTSGTSCHLG